MIGRGPIGRPPDRQLSAHHAGQRGNEVRLGIRRRDPHEGAEARGRGLLPAGHIDVDYRGLHLTVPLNAVNEVRDDAVVLTVDREAVDTQGWDVAPTTPS